MNQTKKYFQIIYLVLLLSIVLFLFVFLPDSVLYAKTGHLKWLPVILLFGGIPILLFIIIKPYNKTVAYIIAFGSVLITGPAFGIQIGKWTYKALEKDGVTVQGKISKKSYEDQENGKGEWWVKAKFKVDGIEYETVSIPDEDNLFKVNEPVEIIYSKRNPEISEFYFMFQQGK